MIDCHLHSEHSGDARGSILETCAAASERGLTHICFTEHLDFEPTDTCYRTLDYDCYRAEIEQAREIHQKRLSIGFGVEVDYQVTHHDSIERYLAEHSFDYILGAVHYVGGIILEDHQRYFTGKQAQEAYAPYLENALAAVRTGWFDTLAHLDLCKRYGVRYYGRFDWRPYRDCIGSILQEVIDRGMALEINSSGLRQSPGETYPSAEIVGYYRRLGGTKVTVGSDSHCPEDAGRGIQAALGVIAEAGFETVAACGGGCQPELALGELQSRSQA